MKFKDKSYWDQRRTLRDFENDNEDIHRIVHNFALKIKEKLNDPILDILLDYNIIKKYLIEGYLVFVNNTDSDKNWNPVTWKDPCNMVFSLDENKKIVCEEWAWKDIVETYNINDIVYITPYDDHLSFVHYLYKGEFGIDDEYHINSVLESFTKRILDIDKVLKIDSDIRRSFKLKRIYDKVKQG